MQQFVVPQFIDVEDKIIGPLTTRQFIILLVTGFLVFLQYKLSDFTLFVLEGVLTLAIGGTFAFMKVNGMPVHFFLINLLESLKRPKIRVWRKVIDESELRQAVEQPIVVIKAALPHKGPLQSSRLQELALQVDTGGSYKAEDENAGTLEHKST